MNDDELYQALDALAGPPPAADTTARAAVTGRVRRARRRIGAVTTATVLVAAVGTAGIAQSAASDGSGGEMVTSRAARCTSIPRAVPRAEVPAEVKAWVGRGAAVGDGDLWTARRVLRGGSGASDGVFFRFKFGWLVLPTATSTPPTLTARRVGGPGRATGEVGTGFDQNGRFFPSTIELTGRGTCWEITARHGDDAITFRRIARAAP
jgi:hypothetical protein